LNQESQINLREKLIAEYAAVFNVPREEAEADYRTAVGTELGPIEALGVGMMRESSIRAISRRFRSVAVARGVGDAVSDKPHGHITVNQRFTGTELHIHPGQDVTDHGAPGQIRGPSE
jgi:hypothetical protein